MKHFEKHQIPGRITFSAGQGGLPKVNIQTAASTAELYLHGAQVSGFQKLGQPPLLFMSRLSHFSEGKPIRGGVPICFPWFGVREGQSAMHGFARVTNWDVVSATAEPNGGATVRLRMPETAARAGWPPFQTEFIVTVADTLTMELITTNSSTDRSIEFENCLHTYFAVGDIREVSVTGLKSVYYLDKADQGKRKQEAEDAIRITQETNRTYLDTAGVVEIHDAKFGRTIRVEKTGSNSTVVWNPWTTQLMPDFAVEEHQHMVCVESGNVGQNKLTLAPNDMARLKVVLGSQPARPNP